MVGRLEALGKILLLDATLPAGGKKVMHHRVKGDADFTAAPSRIIGPNREAIAAVMLNPKAIAYVSVGLAEQLAAKTKRLKLLKLDGVQPSSATVAGLTYPLCRPLNLTTKGAPAGAAKKFIDHILGPAGQKIVEEQGYTPLKK